MSRSLPVWCMSSVIILHKGMWSIWCSTKPILNTLRLRQNRRHFADDIFKCIFLNENGWIPIEISLKFVPKGPINNIPALVQIMAWRQPGNKPLSEPMLFSLLTNIFVTRPKWVNDYIQDTWGKINNSESLRKFASTLFAKISLKLLSAILSVRIAYYIS